MTIPGEPDPRVTLRSRWNAFVEPTADGLPNRRVIVLPLAGLALLLIALVALGVTGSSSGAVHDYLSSREDSDLIAGQPQPIRSDEWFVQTPWTISQVEQAFPIRNEAFPGGMDATVQHDLPAADWSTAFRPHLLGFFFLPLDQAMAVKWWLPGFALIAAVYLFVIALLPRRPIAALALGVGFFFSPFLQWWYLSISFYPLVWGLLVMTTVVWCLRSRRPVGRWVLAALTAYVTVAMGTGIYVPFIIPVVIVAFGFGLGCVLTSDFGHGGVVRRLGRVVPVFIAGGAAAAILGVWLATRWSTIIGFTSTVYPGERLQAVGNGGWSELSSLLSGFLSFRLDESQGVPFGANSSEASTFLLPGLFVSIVLLSLTIQRLRERRGVDWLSVGLLGSGAVMLAFVFLPNWDYVAHLLFVDRTTYGRIRLGFGLLSLVIIVVTALRIDERRREAKAVVIGSSLIAAGLASLSISFVLLFAFRHSTGSELSGRDWIMAGASSAIFVVSVWFFARGRATVAAVLSLLLALLSALTVNPLYRGVLDLRETATAQQVELLDRETPGGAWVGLNTTVVPTMILVESGVTSFNGFQSAPSSEMWAQVDPTGSREEVWNRLANVSWIPGAGNPDPRNPAPDQIQMTFDSCDEFAQAKVTWVLSETVADQACLRLVETIPEGPTTMRIYEVTPREEQ